MSWTVLNSKVYNALKILASRLRRLKLSQQCKDAAGKANKMLGFIKGNFFFQNENIIRKLYISLVKPLLDYLVQFWSPHHAKDIAKLEAAQRKATKMITPVRKILEEEKLARLNIVSLEKKTAPR